MSEKVKILVRTALSPYSGYGRDGLEMITAMERAGLDVYLQPVHVDPPLPQNVADLLMKELKAPFDITYVHQDPGAFDISDDARRATRVAVLSTMWEYSTMDNLTPVFRKRNLGKRMKNFDLVLGYDDVTTDCFREYVPKRGKQPKLATLQGGFEPRNWPYVERDWFSEKFHFFMLGQLSSRKEPFATIQAFHELKLEGKIPNAHLHMKNNIRTLHPAIMEMCPDIHIYYETWSTEKIRSFYSQMHMILAPSRGEGKNLPCLEFQSTGGVAAATNWGGMTNWLHPDCSFPLDYVLRPAVGERYPDCLNARVEKEFLKKTMEYAYNNRGELERKGKIASDYIAQTCSWDSVIQNLLKKVRDVSPDGADVYGKYQFSQLKNKEPQDAS